MFTAQWWPYPAPGGIASPRSFLSEPSADPVKCSRYVDDERSARGARPPTAGDDHAACLTQEPRHIGCGNEVLDQDLGLSVSMHAHLRDIYFRRLVRRKENVVMRGVFVIREFIRS
jgi:hypothetical protein